MDAQLDMFELRYMYGVTSLHIIIISNNIIILFIRSAACLNDSIHYANTNVQHFYTSTHMLNGRSLAQPLYACQHFDAGWSVSEVIVATTEIGCME